MEKSLIVAYGRNREIGTNGDLPWGRSLPADLAEFRKRTLGGSAIMGRKTFESMGSKPLPKRISFIITTQLDYAEQNNLVGSEKAYVMHNLDDALTQAASLAHGAHLDTIWVIGGERVFSEAMMYTDRVELTHVDTVIEDGDAFYPELPNEFVVTAESEQKHDEKSGLDFRFVTYKIENAE